MPQLRRLSRREAVLLALATVAVIAAVYWALRSPNGLPLTRSRPTADAAVPPIPRIDLARLETPRSGGDAGRRNLFDYGAPPVPVATPPPVVVATPPPAPPGGMVAGADGSQGPGVTAVPPLNVRYIGSVENATGVKVAVLVTDRQEILTGQPGQVVANRYRISRIGLESVDLEDISTGQSRRVPLRGGS